MITKKEVFEKRKQIIQLAEKKYTFNKKDKRVQAPRVCVVCGRPLSSLIVHENRYVVSYPHNRYYLGGWIIVDICKDITSCYRTLKKKGELVENVNG
ncbi:hypothetical protein [Collinsella aerofaciens]|uniref:hypothetical protein n=1 Tax=Collinsella aerofaciens TaxID=74426 RepID=UPI001D009056|nr:hypothetical protein [Collinsella aerofaciens]MCB5366978.1 hypothetical protein [Collinsella aerofaciens]MCB5369028.1 hypothetical protein [Collinsella aerofaciens]